MAWPQIVFFDAGGTLIDPSPSVGAIYAEVAQRFGLALDPAQTQHAFEKAFRSSREQILCTRNTLFGTTEETAREFWRAAVSKMFEELRQKPEQFDPLFDSIYREMALASRYALLEGASEVLAELHRRGIRTGVISNWDHRLRGILQGLQLSEGLDPVVISCEMGTEKPDPGIYAKACELADVRPEDAVMIGDSPGPDVEGAQKAGLSAVLYDPSGWYHGPLEKISRLTEIPAWIDKHRA